LLTSPRARAYCRRVDASALLAPLAASPGAAALIFDVDGTLAPIVPRPELAEVPAETRAVLGGLAARYLLVACVSGRPGDEASALVGVPGIRAVGNHGLELSAEADSLRAEISAFREQIAGRWPVEDKGLSLSLHYREADDETALPTLGEVAALAEAHGLDPRWGRKVLEIRPRVSLDKGTAVRHLLAGSGARFGLYAGDDATDADAFRGLGEAGLERAVRVAVDSAEADPGLLAAADLVVAGPAGLLALLRAL